jgi:hyperosmotically inducible periplasmic protein
MRDHFMTAAALVAAVLLAAPLSAGAADTKADKPASTMDKAEGKMEQAKDKAKDTAQDMKGAVSDSWLTSKTKIALFADERVKGREVSVETVGGQVFLRGKVDSDEGKKAAEEIAKGVEGVKSVKNDLQVVPSSARKAVTADDKQITKAVTARLAKDPQLKKIDVRADAGVVVLSGEVQTMAQSARASDLAHRIDGVKSVKNELRVAAAKAN